MKLKAYILASCLLSAGCSTSCKGDDGKLPSDMPQVYRNPVIGSSTPDPSIIRVEDGSFYLYSTEDTRNLPIFHSTDLVQWKFVGTAFTEETRPDFEPKGGLWAPDINYINGKYVLYYSMSVWGGEWTCGIGIATADRPEGPFTDRGMLFRSNTIGVQNSIDPFYMEDDGQKYLFWGSFHGIYGIELTADGLSIRPGAEKKQVAGTAYEGTYIHKRGKYYYLFASIGSCCEGLASTYTTVAGRSDNLWGPYLNKNGQSMSDNQHEIIIHKSEAFVGVGHNSEIVRDEAGNDWIFYHGVNVKNPRGRCLLLDQIFWKNDWPVVENAAPSSEAPAPVFKVTKGIPVSYGDPFILLHEGTYYAYGTSAADGISVLTSGDLQTWDIPENPLALDKKDVWADRWFWAPEVYCINGKFYMYYSADEHICVATADNPLGPFRQEIQKPMIADEKCIDNSLFIDDDGKAYLFFDRFNDGLNIWVAELEDNLLEIKKEAMQKCIHVSQPWEEVWPRVNEGSFVVKHGGIYYMTYSANSYESPYYGIGVATAPNVKGPWTKYEHNPIYQNVGELTGIGHSAMFTDKEGHLRIVFHSHSSKTKIHPRTMHISNVYFKTQDGKEIMVIDPVYMTPVLNAKK